MGIPVYTWAIDVRVIKMVRRGDDGTASRYTAADRDISLTEFLGDGGSVRTSKSLSEPAGSFEISFGDRMDISTSDSVCALVEPMDLLEIRAARFPEDYAGQDLPLVMRGFVDSVRRSESIGDDGTPRRGVVVSGHDSGKLLLVNSVIYELAIAEEKPMLTTFGLQAAIGLEVDLYTANDFVEAFVTKVLNQRVAEMEAFSSQLLKRFIPETSVSDGIVVPQVLGSIQGGTYWSILAHFSDRPWNEIFVRDEEDGPHLVFREVPYRDLQGRFIMSGALDPGSQDVDVSEVVQLDVLRSDARVANFFWCAPGTSSLITNQYITAGSIAAGTAIELNHANNAPALYATRKMEVTTSLLPTHSAGLPVAMLPPSEQIGQCEKFVLWHRARAAQLQAANEDNAVFEEGQATLLGRETYRIGEYLNLHRGDLSSEFYTTAVGHVFQPLGSWTTTLRLERGTGFFERVKLSGSPYLAEGRSGPYTK